MIRDYYTNSTHLDHFSNENKVGIAGEAFEQGRTLLPFVSKIKF